MGVGYLVIQQYAQVIEKWWATNGYLTNDATLKVETFFVFV